MFASVSEARLLDVLTALLWPSVPAYAAPSGASAALEALLPCASVFNATKGALDFIF